MIEAELSHEVRRLILAANAAAQTVAMKAGQPQAAAPPAVVKPHPLCVYLTEDPLPAGETARLGLSVLRQWRQCSQGYGAKGIDGNGYICGCAPWPDGGCGGCPSYVAGNNS